jgi:hypothetical protein
MGHGWSSVGAGTVSRTIAVRGPLVQRRMPADDRKSGISGFALPRKSEYLQKGA